MRIPARTYAERDVYLDYPFEGVMFRWGHDSRSWFRRFYGEGEVPVPPRDELHVDAQRFGEEISKAEYLRGQRGPRT